MDIKDLQENWDMFGKIDPLWATLSFPDKRGNRWQIDEFFETGFKEINALVKYVETLGINIPMTKALDFGCGVGRLTQALAHYFDEVCGVDIAPSMIMLAKKYNRQGDKCRYYLNETDDLKLFTNSSFNFIYTNITLQHIEPRYSKSYLKEFLRILAPHGLLIFQQPSERILRARAPSKRLKQSIEFVTPKILLDFYRKAKFEISKQQKMEMYGIKQEELQESLEENGAKIVDIVQGQSAPGWISFRYCVTKEYTRVCGCARI